MKQDSDDQLSTYFRDLAEHSLLSPQQEQDLSKAIETAEVATWEILLGDLDRVASVLAMVPGVSFSPLLRCGTQSSRRKKLVRDASAEIRKWDVDRVHIETVLRALAKWNDSELSSKVLTSNRKAIELRNRFTQANLRLVVTMARRYARGGMPLSDLIQEGNLGLMHAVSRFDYRRGLRFSTFACWWIRHAIGRALADKSRVVRVPVHMVESQQQVEKARRSLVGELGRPPTAPEIAKAARVSIAKVEQLDKYMGGQTISLDHPTHGDDDRSLEDTLPDIDTSSPEDTMTMEVLVDQVKKFMKYLTPIEVAVVDLRFGFQDDEEKTFREIGEKYQLSRERIRQIQNSALDKLKKLLEREHNGHVEI